MNLLKALEGISLPEKPSEEKNTDGAVPSSAGNADAETPPAPAGAGGVQKAESFNAMQSVLERHEAIANRVKNKQRGGR